MIVLSYTDLSSVIRTNLSSVIGYVSRKLIETTATDNGHGEND